ncbi:alpha/beta hydrolase [Luteibacter pinisoli]|uniref:Alpha/beta hydrolase n=1 Tax=Luteibacter pinisoli TaxID=2589080 RepID=A0A4Y5Z4G9_9GAMM|nr:alpha/beta hydrolase [Luteibacter pinisoli]QDE39826.1 alpha/beta hydrolase [Luteibacter pinisoli]
MGDERYQAMSRRGFMQAMTMAMAAGAAFSLSLDARGDTAPTPKLAPSPGKFTERFVMRDGHRIYVRDYPGKGPAYVMVHGFPDNARIYEEIAPRLSGAGHRVIAFDFLGFGASDKPDGYAYSFVQQLADMKAVVAALKPGPVITVGHDAGGPAAINFALDNPDSVEGIVLFNCYYANSPVLAFPDFIELCCNPKTKLLAHAMMTDPAQAQYLFNFQQGLLLRNMTPALQERFKTRLQPIIASNFTSQPSAMPAFLAMTGDAYANLAANDRRVPELRAFKKPVRLIWGKWDKYLNEAVARDIAGHFPNATYTGLDAEHWPQYDAPDEVVRAMLSPA